MFFRSLTLFRFSIDVARDLARLEDVLPEHKLRPVGPMELSAQGFVPPLGLGTEVLVHTVGSASKVVVGAEDKILPSSVVNDEVSKRVQKIAEGEGRSPGRRERKRIKDDVMNELVARAFVRTSRIAAYADTANGWLAIDTASRKVAENVLSQLRMALGSFPATPLAPEASARLLMTLWVSSGELPEGFQLGDECELRDPATASGAVVRCRRQDIDTDEIREHLRTGKQVFSLGLVFDERISFVLTENLVLRKVSFTDVVLDDMPDAHESRVAELDGTLALMSLEHQRLLSRPEEIFKIPRPE